MSSNLGIAGLPPGTDVVYRTTDAAQRDIARTIGINTAGLPVGTTRAERAPARLTDGDEVFKAALVKAHDAPKVLKSEEPTERKSDHEVAGDRVTQEGRVVNLIKTAHAHGQDWDPFAERQGGAIAKLKSQVGAGEVGEIGYEGGNLVIKISKAA